MTEPVDVDDRVLADHPLPDPSSGDDKLARGTALVVGGCAETPGAMLLAGLAALRAGAGRLQIALAADDGTPLAVAVPESRVIAIGDVGSEDDLRERSSLRTALEGADAVLVGSGATREAAEVLLRAAVDAMVDTDACLVVDAASLAAAADDLAMFRDRTSRTLLIPNDSEAAQLIGVDRDQLAPAQLAAEIVDRTGCTVAVRGPETFICEPGGSMFVERSGPVGLATSGSGDTFAGLVTGYLARGADPLTAALWAARIHAQAGCLAAERHGPVNFLARELVDLLPEAHLAVARDSST